MCIHRFEKIEQSRVSGKKNEKELTSYLLSVFLWLCGLSQGGHPHVANRAATTPGLDPSMIRPREMKSACFPLWSSWNSEPHFNRASLGHMPVNTPALQPGDRHAQNVSDLSPVEREQKGDGFLKQFRSVVTRRAMQTVENRPLATENMMDGGLSGCALKPTALLVWGHVSLRLFPASGWVRKEYKRRPIPQRHRLWLKDSPGTLLNVFALQCEIFPIPFFLSSSPYLTWHLTCIKVMALPASLGLSGLPLHFP